MGLFYTNIVLKGVEKQQVLTHLESLRRDAYVSPTVDGYTVVYDRESDEDYEALMQLSAGLSRDLSCPSLASIVHDGDVYYYKLYEAGELFDEYDSAPDYFDPQAVEPVRPSGGDARKLCEVLGRMEVTEEVAEVLGTATVPDGEWNPDDLLPGEDLHQELAALLGMPPFAAGVGYYVVENGELPEGLDRSALVRTTVG